MTISRFSAEVSIFLATVVLGSSLAMAPKVIDSHLHIWASSKEAADRFPYADGQDPPESLRDSASVSALIERMDDNQVDGALIVQPINHKFDHSYVTAAINAYPERLKGMLLHDPSLSPDDAVSQLENLSLKGYVGVRFNPYLWPQNGDSWMPMSDPLGAGVAVFRRCGDLRMPVGVMCFQGLQVHYDDIIRLLKVSPETTLIIDHFGFTSLTSGGHESFQQLLDLARYPQVVVKISALFRLDDESPYEKVRKERFEPLLEVFGADRLMFGTDFPFVLEHPPDGYGGMVKLVSSWIEDDQKRVSVMFKTAERCFGPWGYRSLP